MNRDFKAWILRASAAGFTAGCRILLRDVPRFGDLVAVQGSVTLFGLIYDVTIRDDPVVRQLVLADVWNRNSSSTSGKTGWYPLNSTSCRLVTGSMAAARSSMACRPSRRPAWMRSGCATRPSCGPLAAT